VLKVSFCRKTEKNIMGLFEIILIVVGLSMDAFAVSITLGLSVEEPKIKFSIWITGSLLRSLALSAER
jgi:putative Mn2+ efflux pump MntP